MSLGTDFYCGPDEDADWDSDVTDDLAEDTDERACFLRAIFRRLTTRRGALWYDSSYGHDVRGYLNDIATDAQIIQEVAQEAMKDERTANALVKVRRTTTRLGDALAIDIELRTIFGATYTMSISVDSATAVRLITQAA